MVFVINEEAFDYIVKGFHHDNMHCLVIHVRTIKIWIVCRGVPLSRLAPDITGDRLHETLIATCLHISDILRPSYEENVSV